MTKKKRILFVVDNLDLGGAQSFVMNVYNSIDKNRFSVDFAVNSLNHGFYENEIEQNGSRIFHLCSPKKIRKYKQLFKGVLNVGQYDVVHCHLNFLSYIPLSCCNKKITKICHAHASYPPSGIFSKIYRYHFKKWIGKHCDYLLGCSDAACKWLYGDNKYEIIENEIDANRFYFNEQKRNITRQSLGINNESFVFINVGNLEPIKRQIHLIKSFYLAKQHIDDMILLILGDGSQKENLKLEISKLHLEKSVFLLGRKNDVQNFLSASDCFVLSSIFEGSPVSLLEAVSNGLPCLVSKTLNISKHLCDYITPIDVENSFSFANNLISATHFKRQRNTPHISKNESIKRLEHIYSE